jgi:hypothetical protein
MLIESGVHSIETVIAYVSFRSVYLTEKLLGMRKIR